MKEFIKALFDEKKQIPFRYKDYDNFFCAGEYHSFYLLFFLQSDKELMDLWKDTSEIFQCLKNTREIYSTDMEKNTMCIYLSLIHISMLATSKDICMEHRLMLLNGIKSADFYKAVTGSLFGKIFFQIFEKLSGFFLI